jgi:hypothetical protein
MEHSSTTLAEINARSEALVIDSFREASLHFAHWALGLEEWAQ